jgi:nucleoside triphosphate diphosphatase
LAVFALESLAKLIALVTHLRGPDGCPWDRAQSYDSMKGLLLEEAYEVIDAVNKRDFDALKDELGDLLFQVVFYARLAQEEQRFALDEVIEGLHAKLVRRHPHVFGEIRARTPGEALASWLAVKEQEREAILQTEAGPALPSDTQEQTADEGQSGVAPSHAPRPALAKRSASLLDGIPKALPATLEAYELGVRVAEVGFDWSEVEDLLDKVDEEVTELRRELVPRPAGDGRLEEEVGDLLFAASNLARYLGSDPESCLRRANQKFKARFQALEQEVTKLGKKVRDCAPEELDRLWNVVKRQEEEARSKK